jgi:hypothetical protein
MRHLVLSLLLLGLAGAAPAAEAPTFTEGPVVEKAGDGARVRFTVSKPTDVEVSVLDAKSRVVRHLAAGVIGRGTPVAPLRAGLAQELAWHGKDDLGKPAARGPFSIRVRVGLGVELDGFFSEAKHHFAAFFGMATDPDGNVYICGASTGNKGPDGTHYTQVFDRSGKYVKTITPMPADLPPEKLRPFNVIMTGDGHVTPRNHRGTWPVFYPGLGGSMAPRIAEDGVIWFTSGKRVAAVRADGSGVGTSLSRSAWKTKPHRTISRWLMSWRSAIAVSPDGKTLYIAGLYQTKPFQKRVVFPPGRVYRLKADGGYAEVFAELQRADGQPARPSGMTVDADGNLLVCDPGGDRIVMLSPAGKPISELAVKDPQEVYVHRKTGIVYVLGYRKSGVYRATKHLIKLDPRPGGEKEPWGKDAKALAKIRLTEEGYHARMALDDSDDPPVVWVGTDRSKAGDAHVLRARARVYRLEDRGSRFVETEHECRFHDDPMGVVTRLAVHPETDVLVCRGEYSAAAAYHGLTGERIKAPFKEAVDMAAGRDGHLYVQILHSWAGPLCKYDKHLKPVVMSLGSKPKNKVLPRVFGRYGNGFGSAGLDVTADGRLYVAQQLDQQTIAGDCVVVFRPDGVAEDHGRLKGHERFKKHGMWNSAIFAPIVGRPGNIQVDREGYMYIALRGLPMNHKAPAGFEKDPAYHAVVGCVVKVKPEGGGMFKLGGPLARPPVKERKVPPGMDGKRIIRRASYPRGPKFVENATKLYPGIGCMSGAFGVGCSCRQPMFQLDPWGRLFIPNAITYSVRVVDNEGNEVLRFGQYGNADSRGEKAYAEAAETDAKTHLIETPAIPLGWPEAVGVSRKAIYVADVLNRRVVRLRKTYAADETRPVK